MTSVAWQRPSRPSADRPPRVLIDGAGQATGNPYNWRRSGSRRCREPDGGRLRPRNMNRPPRRPGRVWAGTVLACTAVAIAGCAGLPPAPRPAIPPEFRAACGHPGASVTVRKVPVTIPHAGCDLTGVASPIGATVGDVPRSSGSIGTSSGLPRWSIPAPDVTVNATGPLARITREEGSRHPEWTIYIVDDIAPEAARPDHMPHGSAVARLAVPARRDAHLPRLRRQCCQASPGS